jgi:hypothetical protein
MPGFGQCVFDIFQFEMPYDGFDLFHPSISKGLSALRAIRWRNQAVVQISYDCPATPDSFAVHFAA